MILAVVVSKHSTLQHIAIIMDGNGRWAKQRDLPRHEGHRRGVAVARLMVREAVKKRIPFLTLFAFSSENWQRPQQEVGALLSLFAEAAEQLADELKGGGVRVLFVGDRTRFSKTLQLAMESLEKNTAHCTALTLIIAVSYSGKWDITQAAASIAANGGNFDEENFARHLTTGDLPPIDLLIRTGGEHRISNFMLWQAAYAELYFCTALWPDFGEEDFNHALNEYAQRERRFGMVQ